MVAVSLAASDTAVTSTLSAPAIDQWLVEFAPSLRLAVRFWPVPRLTPVSVALEASATRMVRPPGTGPL